MNYSTAKTILHLYRKKQKKGSKKIKEENRCHFKQLTSVPVSGFFEVVISQGGKQITTNSSQINRFQAPSFGVQENQKPSCLGVQHKPIAKPSTGEMSFLLKLAICQHLQRNKAAAAQKATIRPNCIQENARQKEQEQLKTETIKRNVIVIRPMDGKEMMTVQ